MRKLRLKKLTARWAQSRKGCPFEVRRFARRFPNGVDLSDATQVKTAWRFMDELSIGWFLVQLHSRGKNCGPDRCSICPEWFGVPGHVPTKRSWRAIAKEAGLPL